jgi:hypothetical protein
MADAASAMLNLPNTIIQIQHPIMDPYLAESSLVQVTNFWRSFDLYAKSYDSNLDDARATNKIHKIGRQIDFLTEINFTINHNNLTQINMHLLMLLNSLI